MTAHAGIHITVPKDLLKEFSASCSANGMSLSSRIAVLIQEDLCPDTTD